MSGTANDQTLGFSYTAASQISQRTAANDAYTWHTQDASRAYTRNGLNQYTNVGGAAFNYDSRGNLISDGSRNFAYDVENRLTQVSGSANLSLAYDPLGRLRSTIAASVTTEFLHDGDNLVAEYSSGGTLLRRYVHGPGINEPLVWYEGAALSDRRLFVADHQGSIIATNDNAGATTIQPYGPYGEPQNWSGSRFRYTGQAALPEVALYHYRARVYDPSIGRYLQTDPIGYDDNLNLYAYVANDPLNLTDTTGTIGGCDGCIREETQLRAGVQIGEDVAATPTQVDDALLAVPLVIMGGATAIGVGSALAAGAPAAGELVAGAGAAEGAAATEAGGSAASQTVGGSLRQGLMRTTNMTRPADARTAVARPAAPRAENPALRVARNEIRDNRTADRQTNSALEASRAPAERASPRSDVDTAAEVFTDILRAIFGGQ